MFWASLAMVCVLFASREAAAQTPLAPPAPSAPEEPAGQSRFNLMGGYSYLHDGAWDEDLFLGWMATLTYRLTTNVSIVGEIGGHHGEYGNTGFSIQRYALLGGMKITGGEDRIRPFFQFVAGGSRQGGDVGLATGIVVQPGGGADFMLTDKITLRAQGDFRWMLEDDELYTGYRVSGGIVIQLGKRR